MIELFCKNCGHKNDTDAEFCVNCGLSLLKNKMGVNNLNKVLFLSCVVLIGSLAVVAGVLLSNPDKTINSIENNTTSTLVSTKTPTQVNKIKNTTSEKKSTSNGIRGVGNNGIKYWIPANHQTCPSCGGPLGYYYIDKVDLSTGEEYTGEYFGCLKGNGII